MESLTERNHKHYGIHTNKVNGSIERKNWSQMPFDVRNLSSNIEVRKNNQVLFTFTCSSFPFSEFE